MLTLAPAQSAGNLHQSKELAPKQGEEKMLHSARPTNQHKQLQNF
jgi:hypothetical protein